MSVIYLRGTRTVTQSAENIADELAGIYMLEMETEDDDVYDERFQHYLDALEKKEDLSLINFSLDTLEIE